VAGDAARHLGRPAALCRHLLVAVRPQYYFAGDGAKKDDEGNIWLLGRVDDVMNVSGHRLSTTEIESALVSHPKVAEAAVVGANDEMTGQAVVAFVILRQGEGHDGDDNSQIVEELRNHVAKEIGPIAKPKIRSWSCPSCPRPAPARSCAACCATSPRAATVGDVTTLADSSVMDLIKTVSRPIATPGQGGVHARLQQTASHTADADGHVEPALAQIRSTAAATTITASRATKRQREPGPELRSAV
jgi:hypothetical protein